MIYDLCPGWAPTHSGGKLVCWHKSQVKKGDCDEHPAMSLDWNRHTDYWNRTDESLCQGGLCGSNYVWATLPVMKYWFLFFFCNFEQSIFSQPHMCIRSVTICFASFFAERCHPLRLFSLMSWLDVVQTCQLNWIVLDYKPTSVVDCLNSGMGDTWRRSRSGINRQSSVQF